MEFKSVMGLLLIALCAAVPHQTLAQTASSSFPPTYSSLPWITVRGTRLAYYNGTYVLLHGADYSGPEFDSFTCTLEDFQAMASWGFNVIRLPIDWSFVEPKPGVYNSSYMSQVKQAVAMANRYGIYVIIDMQQFLWSSVFKSEGGYGLPLWAVPYAGGENAMEKDKAYFWSNTTVEQDFANMWEYVASQFANDPGVLGYDLFNEPTTPTNWTSQQMYENMARVYDMAISAIRKVDQRHVIFFETSEWDSGTHPNNWVEPTDPAHKLALEVHDYWANPLSAPLYAALTAGDRWDVPVYVGEFGSGYNSPLLSTEAFNQYGLAWTYWGYGWTGWWPDVNYKSNPFLGILDEAYPRLSSVPVSSLVVMNVTSDGVVSSVVVNATFAGKSGWADFFIPEGFNVASPSGVFSPSSRTFNVTFDDGNVSLRLSPPPGYGFAGALFTIATSPSEPLAGVPFNVTTWVTSSSGFAMGNADVILLINGKEVASSTTDAQGMAQFTATVDEAGNVSLAVELQKYPFACGNRTIQVLPPPSISLFESTSAVPVGHEVILTASATSQGAPVSRVSISFYCNGSYVGSTTTNSSGVATLVYIPKSVGAVSIMALLSSYPSVSASGKLTVIPATAFRIQISAKAPSIIMVGQAVTLTAVAKFTNGTPVKGADVSFSVNGTIVGIETTDVRGVANLPYVFSKRGIASITASVDGVNSSTSTSVQQANRKQALLHLVVYAGIVVLILGMIAIVFFSVLRHRKHR
ncbi:cellulase family glycosylhydrolase [Tardisphaera saccharovorans]